MGGVLFRSLWDFSSLGRLGQDSSESPLKKRSGLGSAIRLGGAICPDHIVRFLAEPMRQIRIRLERRSVPRVGDNAPKVSIVC